MTDPGHDLTRPWAVTSTRPRAVTSTRLQAVTSTRVVMPPSTTSIPESYLSLPHLQPRSTKTLDKTSSSWVGSQGKVVDLAEIYNFVVET